MGYYPDSENYAIGYCKTCDDSRAILTERRWLLTEKTGDYYCIFECKKCNKAVIKAGKLADREKLQEIRDILKGEKIANNDAAQRLLSREVEWVDPPSKIQSAFKEHEDAIPSHILEDYNSALACEQIQEHRAACMLLRRALESTLIKLNPELNPDQENTNPPPLIKQIEQFPDISDTVKKLLHVIRIFGNWGAHSQVKHFKNVTGTDVTAAKALLARLLDDVFVKKVREEAENKRLMDRISGKASPPPEADASSSPPEEEVDLPF